MFNSVWAKMDSPSTIILSLAIMLISGFLVTRLTKKLQLPNVTGYILAGVIIGPYVLHLVPVAVTNNMGFVTDIALAFIAFGVGRYFELGSLKKNGKNIIIITLLESLVAAVVVTLVMYFVFRLPLAFSLLLGAISSATAPASTLMTIQQYKAKGELVDTLLQVVALDDAVALIAFSVCAAIVQALSGGNGVSAMEIVIPIIGNIAMLIGGFLAGKILIYVAGENRSSGHRLVLVTALLLLLTGICSIMQISPLLSCMAMGITYANFGGTQKLFKQVNQFTPSINLLFFVLSGISLNLASLKQAGIIGVAYFFVRIIGKYLGAWLGGKTTNASESVTKYLGLALVPQAGVSIGLAVLGQRMLPPAEGTLLSTIILSSGFLYEMVGPVCAKTALKLSGSFPELPSKKKSVSVAKPKKQTHAVR